MATTQNGNNNINTGKIDVDIWDFIPKLKNSFRFILFFAFSKSSSLSLEVFKIADADAKDTSPPAKTPKRTFISPPFGARAIIAKILPGDGGAIKPEPKTTFVKTPAIPPKITAANKNGFIKMYGK